MDENQNVIPEVQSNVEPAPAVDTSQAAAAAESTAVITQEPQQSLLAGESPQEFLREGSITRSSIFNDEEMFRSSILAQVNKARDMVNEITGKQIYSGHLDGVKSQMAYAAAFDKSPQSLNYELARMNDPEYARLVASGQLANEQAGQLQSKMTAVSAQTGAEVEFADMEINTSNVNFVYFDEETGIEYTGAEAEKRMGPIPMAVMLAAKNSNFDVGVADSGALYGEVMKAQQEQDLRSAAAQSEMFNKIRRDRLNRDQALAGGDGSGQAQLGLVQQVIPLGGSVSAYQMFQVARDMGILPEKPWYKKAATSVFGQEFEFEALYNHFSEMKKVNPDMYRTQLTEYFQRIMSAGIVTEDTLAQLGFAQKLEDGYEWSMVEKVAWGVLGAFELIGPMAVVKQGVQGAKLGRNIAVASGESAVKGAVEGALKGAVTPFTYTGVTWTSFDKLKLSGAGNAALNNKLVATTGFKLTEEMAAKYKAAEQAAIDSGEYFSPEKFFSQQAAIVTKADGPEASVAERMKVLSDVEDEQLTKALYNEITNGTDPLSLAATFKAYKGKDVVDMLNLAMETKDANFMKAAFGTDNITDIYMSLHGIEFSPTKAKTLSQVERELGEGNVMAIHDLVANKTGALSVAELDIAVRNTISKYDSAGLSLDANSLHYYRDGNTIKLGVVMKGLNGNEFTSPRQAMDAVLYAGKGVGLRPEDVEILAIRGNKLEPISAADIEAEGLVRRAGAIDGYLDGNMSKSDFERYLRDSELSDVPTQVSRRVSSFSDTIDSLTVTGSKGLAKTVKKSATPVLRAFENLSRINETRSKQLVEAAQAQAVRKGLQEEYATALKAGDTQKAETAKALLQDAVELEGNAVKLAKQSGEAYNTARKALTEEVTTFNKAVKALQDSSAPNKNPLFPEMLSAVGRLAEDMKDAVSVIDKSVAGGRSIAENMITGAPGSEKFLVRVRQDVKLRANDKDIAEDLEKIEVNSIKIGPVDIPLNSISQLFAHTDVKYFKGGTGALTNWFVDFTTFLKSKDQAREASLVYDRASTTQKALFRLAQKMQKKVDKMNTAEQTRLRDYLVEANNSQIDWDDVGKEIARSKYMLSDNAMSFIGDFRKMNDILWELENTDYVQRLRTMGNKLLTDNEGTKLVGKELTQKGQATQALNESKNKTLYAKDIDSGEVVPLKQEDIDALYASGGNLFRSHDKFIHAGKAHEFVINNNQAGVRWARELTDTDQLLNKRAGYFHVEYDANYKIVRQIETPDGDIETIVVGMAKTKDEAKTLSNLLLDHNKEWKVDDLKTQHLQEEITREGTEVTNLHQVGGRSEQRIRGNPLQGVSGATELKLADTVDPMKTMVNAIYSASNRVHLREYIESMRQRFLNGFGDLLPTDPNTQKALYPSDVNDIGKGEGGKLVGSDRRIADARDLYLMLENFEDGFSDVFLDGAMRNLFKGMANNVSNKDAETLFRGIADLSIAKAMRLTAVSLYLFSNSLAQLFMQSSQALVTISTLGPRQTVRLGKFLPGILAASIGNIEFAKTLYGAKNAAILESMWEGYAKSGLLAGVDKSSLVRGVFKDMGERLGTKSAAGRVAHHAGSGLQFLKKVGMDAGEYVNVSTAYVAEYIKAVDKGLDMTDGRVLDEVAFKARQISGGMNRAGELAYNGNFLAVPMQFAQIAHKMVMNMTINPHISFGDKMKMWAGTILMFGVDYEQMTSGFLSSVDAPEDVKYAMSQGIYGNFINQALEMLGQDTSNFNADWAGRVRPLSLGALNMVGAIMFDLDFQKALAMSPSGSLFFSHEETPNVPKVANFLAMVRNQFWPDPYALEQSPDQVLEAGLGLFSGYPALKALFVDQMYIMSASGKIKYKDPTSLQLLATSLGVQSTADIQLRALNSLNFEAKEEEEALAEETVKFMKAQAAAAGEPIHGDTFRPQATRIILQTLAEGNTELYSKISGDYLKSIYSEQDPAFRPVQQLQERVQLMLQQGKDIEKELSPFELRRYREAMNITSNNEE